ncbi:MAG: hypothetical protein K8R89_07360, partial [Anaerolineae bacterium]|nr:hypothetical protein [Anaerolineae bacterium]
QLALRQNYAEVKLVLGFVIGCFLSGSLMKLSWEAQYIRPKRKRLSVCASILQCSALWLFSITTSLGYKFHVPWAVAWLPASIMLVSGWIVGAGGWSLYNLFFVEKKNFGG